MKDQGTKPAISVILPVYNGEKYLDGAIESILLQDFKDFELIIVNDRSTDSSLKIMERYAENDARIRILNNEQNLKLPASLNKGHEASRAELMTWTSDDNLPHKDWLSSLYAEMQRTNADIVFSNHTHIDEKGHFMYESYTGPVENLPVSSCIGASFLYHRKVFESLGGYNTDLFLIEDYDFWVRAYKKGFTWSHLPTSLYDYRTHSQSLSSSSAKKAAETLLGYKLAHINEYKMRRRLAYTVYMDIINSGGKAISKRKLAIMLLKAFCARPLKFLGFYMKMAIKIVLRHFPKTESLIRTKLKKSHE